MTHAVKHDGQKPRYDYLSWPVLDDLALVCAHVAKSRAWPNSQGHAISQALTHLAAYQRGFDADPVTGMHPCVVATYFTLAARLPVLPGGGTVYTELTPTDDLMVGRYVLLPWAALDEVAAVMTFGAAKYGAHNYRYGLDHGRLFAAAMRHLVATMRGEECDSESGFSHIAHAAASLMMLVDSVKALVGTDTRWATELARRGTNAKRFESRAGEIVGMLQ